MIQYALKCENGHRFDSWFQSAAAFDKLTAVGMVTCEACGSSKVEKAIMAPRVQSARKSVSAQIDAQQRQVEKQAEQQAEQQRDQTPAASPGTQPTNLPTNQPSPSAPADISGSDAPASLSAPDSDQARAIQELKKQVEANSEYVGKSFADEARAMHLGDTPERAIHGEANLDDAKQLLEDGVPVVPLPFTPGRKTN